MCIYCATDNHYLCLTPLDNGKCCCLTPGAATEGGLKLEAPERTTTVLKVGRKQKSGEELENVLAAGRLRAAALIPIDKDNPVACSWRGLKFAGGGVNPIVGCKDGIVEGRHHGPDKSVLTNVLETNLHPICDECHRRWHARNDVYYGEATDRPADGSPWWPKYPYRIVSHDPITRATDKDYVADEYARSVIRKASKHNQPHLLKLLPNEGLTDLSEYGMLESHPTEGES